MRGCQGLWVQKRRKPGRCHAGVWSEPLLNSAAAVSCKAPDVWAAAPREQCAKPREHLGVQDLGEVRLGDGAEGAAHQLLQLPGLWEHSPHLRSRRQLSHIAACAQTVTRGPISRVKLLRLGYAHTLHSAVSRPADRSRYLQRSFLEQSITDQSMHKPKRPASAGAVHQQQPEDLHSVQRQANTADFGPFRPIFR